jgi:hypothetical protein
MTYFPLVRHGPHGKRHRQQGDLISSLTEIRGNIQRDGQQTDTDGYKYISLRLFFQDKEIRLKNQPIVVYNIAYSI